MRWGLRAGGRGSWRWRFVGEGGIHGFLLSFVAGQLVQVLQGLLSRICNAINDAVVGKGGWETTPGEHLGTMICLAECAPQALPVNGRTYPGFEGSETPDVILGGLSCVMRWAGA